MKMIRNPNIEIDFDDNIGVIWLPWWLSGKESACNSGDVGSIAGSESSPWRSKQQPTLVFLPGKSHGQRSLEGYSHGVAKEPDTA